MNRDAQERYIKIIRKAAEDGLDILENIDVRHPKFQQIVVNINNASNIAYQLEEDLKRQDAETALSNALSDIPTVNDYKEDKPKRKYTKKVK